MTDNGLSSRKLWYAIGTSIGILVVGLISALWPAFRPTAETIVGGLLGSLALYSGANVGNKFVMGKVASALSQSDPERPQGTPPIEPHPEEEK